MGNADDKNIDKVNSFDNVARAKLYHHLSHKGYIVNSRDEIGPISVLVNGMFLQEWERDSVDLYKGGRQKGKARDIMMRLVSSRAWTYE